MQKKTTDKRTDKKIVDSIFAEQRVLTENSEAARELYNQSRFGTLLEEGKVQLSLYEALYLVEKKKLKVFDGRNKEIETDKFLKKARKIGLKQGPMLGKLQEGKEVVVDGKKVRSDQVSQVVKGKKIVYLTDTALCKNCYELANNADLLISEASYTSKLEAKAREYHHLTAKQAGLVASKSNVKKLVLTHFSARYKSSLEIEEDARGVFDNVFTAEDFMKVDI